MALKLLCYFPAKSCVIPIKTEPQEFVQDLANSIYNDPRVQDVELGNLRLYKTDIAIEPFEDQAERALEWLNKQETNAFLDPAKRLGAVFSGRLSDSTFHIIVALAPGTQEKRALDTVSLNCFVHGDAPDKIFTIMIPKDCNVSTLKDLIKEKKHVQFGQIEATDLQLVQVSLPLEDDQAPKDINIGQKQPLANVKKISNLFPNPRDDELHVIVLRPTDIREMMEPFNSPVPVEYRRLIMNAHQRGRITTNDLLKNAILEEGSPNVQVQEFERLLQRPRRFSRGAELVQVGKKIYSFLSSLSEPIADATPILTEMNIGVSPDGETTPEAGYACSPSEAIHVVQALGRDHSKPSASDAFSEIHYSEGLANDALFYPFALTLRNSPRFKFRFGNYSWPFKILIQVDQIFYSYQPKSDFQFAYADLPLFLVEVQSQDYEEDKSRMLFQAAFVVKMVNTLLERFSEKKDFFLVTAYITRDGMVERRIVYLDGEQVKYTKPRIFKLSTKEDHVAFLCELYNLASRATVTGPDLEAEDTFMVSKLKTEFNAVAKKPGVRAWTSKRPRNQPDDGSTDEFAEQLEVGGYQVGLSTDDDFGGIWETVGLALPSTVRTVYKKSDVKQTNPMIAKRASKSSSSHEVRILQYLSAKPSPSPYIVSLLDHFAVGTVTYLIFSKMSPVSEDALRCGKIKQPRQSLVSGIAYLHMHGVAHLDLKPDNLLYHTHTGQLKITDFDIAERVESEEQEIEGYGGTPGWTAPEIGEEGGPKQKYSAIRADRWACGRILKMFLQYEAEPRFARLAEQLLAENPRDRPSLVEWCKVDSGDVEVGGEMANMHRRERTDDYNALVPLPKRLKVAPVVDVNDR